MRLDDLDETLKRQPIWDPPGGFAARVVSRWMLEELPRAIPELRPGVSVARGIVQGTLAATTAYVAGRFVWLATPDLIAHTMAVAWTCALLSLAVAASFTHRVLRP